MAGDRPAAPPACVPSFLPVPPLGPPSGLSGAVPSARTATGPRGLVSCAVNPVGQSVLRCLKSL